MGVTRKRATAWVLAAGWLCLLGGAVPAAEAEEEKKSGLREPALVLPYWDKAPTLDGVLEPGEWEYAANITMFEAYPGTGSTPRVMRGEQPIMYVYWDKEYLYLALDSLESNTNTVVASTVQHDHAGIIGNDCVELMVAPGAGEAIERYDFPVFYWALNAIGTVWDAKFVPRLAEKHNSWESGIETASTVDGTRWVMEVRLPLDAIRKTPPEPGETWRMNFDRTYSGYEWSAWNAKGGLNKAEVGGDVTFADDAPAIRIHSLLPLMKGRLGMVCEAANATEEKKTVTFRLSGRGGDKPTAQDKAYETIETTVTAEPGRTAEARLLSDQILHWASTVCLEALDSEGRLLYRIEREIRIPIPRLVKKVARKVPMVYVFPRYLPSLDRLAVEVDCTAWVRKTGFAGSSPKAIVTVRKKDEEKGDPVFEGALEEFEDNRGVWRHSTADLPEGEYAVHVRVETAAGALLAEHDDWFEKRVFDWMKNPPGQDEKVPPLYAPLAVEGASVKPWGRDYRFDKTGLPQAMDSQKKPLLAEGVTLLPEIGGKPAALEVETPFAVTSSRAAEVTGAAALRAGDVNMRLEMRTEFDGLVVYRLTYGPKDGEASLDRLRVRIPLTGAYCRFYSAAGDTQGTGVLGDVLPMTQGKVFDSSRDTYNVTQSPTFATIFWTGDYETCFCYAADICKGWALRDDAPAVEAYREGDQLVLWLNLVDRPLTLTGPRTLEFALQAGPTKALPKGWRGLQYGGNPEVAPVTFINIGGSGFTLHGSPWFIHPGLNEAEWEKSRQRLKKRSRDGTYTVLGYHRWPAITKGLPAARVFRGEWGLDKATWDAARKPRSDWMWGNRFYGEEKDRYVFMMVKPMPSYTRYAAHGFDLALEKTSLAGFYDDTGYPVSVYDEEFDLGYVREDGRKIYSSGLWVYRERWKRAALVAMENGKPNYTCDSQHVIGHHLPAYGFIGIWAPCERGYYNPFKSGDNLDFYQSLERYYAINPSHAFGQVALIGMSTPQRRYDLQVRDTRCMCMLAFLHDQSLGSWGHREKWTQNRLHAARNVFRGWEEDVTFSGYWKNADTVKTSDPDLRVSYWKRPGSVLLAVGNIGDDATEATVSPDWAALGVDAASLEAVDPETGEVIPVKNGSIPVNLARHDLRLVLAGAVDDYAWKPSPLLDGADLPRPADVLDGYALAGPALGDDWTVEVPKTDTETANVGFVAGRLFTQSDAYGYAYARRELKEDDVVVQVCVESAGGNPAWGGGVALWWADGSYVRAVPDTRANTFEYQVAGTRSQDGTVTFKEEVPPRMWPYRPYRIRIRLTPESIVFDVSPDGKTWREDHTVARGETFAGAPAHLVLGNGHPGDEPFLANVHPKHYRPYWGRHVTFFSDLVVGKE